MDCTKSIGDEDFCHGCQFLGKVCPVLLFADIVSQVFKKHELAGLQCSCFSFCIFPDDIFGKDDVLAKKLAEAFCNRSQAEFRFPFSLGLAKMRAGNNCGTVFQQILDSGQCSNNTFIAGDLSGLFIQRNVKITSQKNFFALYVCVFYAFFVIVHNCASIVIFI